MQTKTRKMLLEFDYARAALDFLQSRTLEHVMESITQSTQRKITVESLDLVTARRPEIQVFSELLVQYPRPGERRLGQVVPDNMVVIHDEPIEAEGTFDVPFQPVGPFWVLEYVSKSNRRKDYVDNKEKYEHDLKVPYYLLFEPDREKMTLYRHAGKRYAAVAPGQNGRSAIKKLAIEVALLDGWVRFWYEGELLPLPGEMLRMVEAKNALLREKDAQLAEANRRADTEREARLAAEREVAELRARMKNGKK